MKLNEKHEFEYTFDLTYGSPMYISFIPGTYSEITKYPEYIVNGKTTNELELDGTLLASSTDNPSSSTRRIYLDMKYGTSMASTEDGSYNASASSKYSYVYKYR